MLFKKKNNIVYSVKDSTETGLFLSDTSIKGVGGTFTVKIEYSNLNKVKESTNYDTILFDIIDQLDHCTITDISKIKDINNRYFIVDLNKMPKYDSVTIYACTLISILNQLPSLYSEINSVTVTLGKHSISITNVKQIQDCIIDYSTLED